MPHLNVTYHTQTMRLDLKLTLLCTDNKVDQHRSQKCRPTPGKCSVPSMKLINAVPTPGDWESCRHALCAPISMTLINAIHLEPGMGGSPPKSSKWSQRDIAKRKKTDWLQKDKLVAEFKEDLHKLKKPTCRALLPPPELEYEEVIHQITFQSKKGWKTQHDPPDPDGKALWETFCESGRKKIGWEAVLRSEA